jgi:hypothetical protein
MFTSQITEQMLAASVIALSGSREHRVDGMPAGLALENTITSEKHESCAWPPDR